MEGKRSAKSNSRPKKRSKIRINSVHRLKKIYDFDYKKTRDRNQMKKIRIRANPLCESKSLFYLRKFSKYKESNEGSQILLTGRQLRKSYHRLPKENTRGSSMFRLNKSSRFKIKKLDFSNLGKEKKQGMVKQMRGGKSGMAVSATRREPSLKLEERGLGSIKISRLKRCRSTRKITSRKNSTR